MLTELQIANNALHLLGSERISSLSYNNKRAKVLNDLLPAVRQEVLESYPWDFALIREKITENGNTPAFEWTYEFDLPADFLSIHQEYNDEEYKEESDKILANAATLSIIYIKNITDHSLFSATFDKALYTRLAAEASYTITQDKSLKAGLLEESEFFKDRSQSYNAKRSTPEDYDFDYFNDSRL